MQTSFCRAVADLDQSTTFFVNNFGFTVFKKNEDEEEVFLLPPGQVLLCLKKRPPEAEFEENPDESIAVHAIEFIVNTEDEFKSKFDFFDSVGLVHDWQDFVPYSDLGEAILKGSENEKYFFTQKSNL